MSPEKALPYNYDKILYDIIKHIEQSKLRAFAEVNKALLDAYWSIGRELSKNSAYGSSVFEKLSRDLRIRYPNTKGYSLRNLWNMKKFYETYQKLQTVPAELLFSISWSNHVVILDSTNSDIECMIQTNYSNSSSIIQQFINECLFIAEKSNIKNAKEQPHFSKFNSSNSSEVEYNLTFNCFYATNEIDNMRIKQYSKSRILRGIHSKLPDFFIESYNELIKNSFPSKKIKRGAKLIRESNSATKLLTSDNHINIVNIANKLCRGSLENSLFSCSYIQSNGPGNAAIEDRKNSSGVNDCRGVNFFVVFDKGNRNYGIIRTAEKSIRELHKMLISSSLRGTFISITSSNFMPFSLRIASTSETESADAAIPFSVRPIHLPLCFSASSGCDDSHSSSFIFSTFNIHKETGYLNLTVIDSAKICSKYPKNLDVWIDYADTGVAVNKKPGDKLKLNIYSDNSATVKISYNKDVFSSIDCFTFHPIFSGINACNLVVKDGIEDSEEEIKVENKITKVNIIGAPEFLIITDSEKLSQELHQEPNGVKAVLKQAYANAEKDNGVVYDLSWYKAELGVNNPFDRFS